MTDAGPPIRVLFVCTGQLGRSIMAEALLRDTAATDFEVHSAGTDPKGVNPLTLRSSPRPGSTRPGRARSPSTSSSASRSTTSITVCDQARQVCPVFPGGGESLHWGYEDPAEATGTDEERLARLPARLHELGERIRLFVAARPARQRGADAATSPA